MSEPLTDCLEFAGDTVVRASAGTGKTFLLVEKFIHTLKQMEGEFHTPLDTILAITFTDKAANEMRHRISQRIIEEIRECEKKKPAGGQVRLVRHLRRSRRQIGQAYISTIHSLCARVLRENPIEAGVDPGFKIMDAARTAQMMEQALEQFLLMRLRKGDAALIELAYRYGYSSDYAYQYSVKRIMGSLLPLLRAASTEPHQLLREYEKLARGLKERLSLFKTGAEQALQSLEHEANTQKRKDRLDALKEGISRLSSASDAKSEDGYRLADELSKAARGFGFKSGAPAREAADRLREALDGYSKTVVSALVYKNSVQLRDLLGDFYAFYENRIKSGALLDFDDLQERTLRLFSRRPQTLDNYRKKFRRVMVDEFQDVNGLQKKIIYLLARPGEGRLFIVGDPKQAIYGFRGGDVEVFHEAQKEIVENSGRLFYIRKNYRSNPELVEFTNGYFSRYSNGVFTEDDLCDADRAESGSPAVESIAFIQTDMTADDARFREASLIAARIKEMVTGAEFMVADGKAMRDVKYGDIAVLFRKFTALPLYESALSAANLPYMIHKGSGFYQSQEVADLLNVLSYIENGSDLVSWVGALRSPFAGCSDEMILRLRRAPDGGIIDPLTYAGSSKPRVKGADPLDVEKFMEFTGWAHELMSVKERMTVSELIETVLEKSRITGILGAQPNGLQKVANVLKLIETARTMEQNSVATLKNFIRRAAGFVETGSDEPQALVAAADEDMVRVMTIHQSKGLEFPVVILADVNSVSAPKQSPVIFNPQRGLAVKYVDKTRLSSHKGVVFDETNRVNTEKEQDDDTRIFYVACTRARDRLVLSGWRRQGRAARTQYLDELADNSPELFVDSTEPKCAAAQRQPEKSVYDHLREEAEGESEKEKVRAAKVAPVKRDAVRRLSLTVGQVVAFARCPREYLFRSVYGIAPGKTADDGGTKRQGGSRSGAAELGAAVHSAMELVEFAADKVAFKKSATSAVDAKLSRQSNKEKRDAVKSIAALYDTDPFTGLRSGALSIAGREVDFTARFGGGPVSCLLRGKLDLLLRDGRDGIWVVDYKYSRAPAADSAARLQLELYALAMFGFIKEIKSATCALVYMKGEKPRVQKWNLDRAQLRKIEERLLKSSLAIYEWEEIGRRLNGGRLPSATLPAVDCPDARCDFKEFCLFEK